MVDDREPDRTAAVAKNDLQSDRWLSNSEEIVFNGLSDLVGIPRGPNTRLDVWDPDTDDD